MSKDEIIIRVREILAGIDESETESEIGWFETSTGAKFGAEKLDELLAFLRSSLPE